MPQQSETRRTRAKARVTQVRSKRGYRRPGFDLIRFRSFDLVDGEINQSRASEIEDREEIEICRQPKHLSCACGDEAADQIAGYVASDVGSEGAAAISHAALFTEIGDRQRKCRRHAKPLQDSQKREGG